MEPTKIYIQGSVHAGKTALALYLTSYLKCSFEQRPKETTPEIIAALQPAVKAGLFYGNPRLEKFQIKLECIPEENSSVIKVEPYARPQILISIVQKDPATLDEAKYLVARALADINMPELYLGNWTVTQPLDGLKQTSAIVIDGPMVTTSPYRGAAWNSLHTTSLVPYAIINPNQQLLRLIHRDPQKEPLKFQVGMDETVAIELSESKYVVVRLLTLNGEWGVMAILFSQRGLVSTIAFKRELIYDVLSYCKQLSNRTIPLSKTHSIHDLLLERLKESNLTRARYQLKALETIGDPS